jgi:hypothetical protein
MALAVLALGLQYRAQAVIIRGGDLVMRTGMVWTREHIVPNWDVRPELRQSILGRRFDYATVYQRTDIGTVRLRAVAEAQELRLLIAERRMCSPVRLACEQIMYPSIAVAGAEGLALAPARVARRPAAVFYRIIR